MWKSQLMIIEEASGKSETYSEPSDISKMEIFAKNVDCFHALIIFSKHFILVASQGYEYASDKTKEKSGALSFVSQKIRTAIPANFFHF